ncbi:hypothetical protein BPJM79_160018 [Bacillus pumilus]
MKRGFILYENIIPVCLLTGDVVSIPRHDLCGACPIKDSDDSFSTPV